MGAKVKTFFAEKNRVVDLLTGPTSTGLCKVAYGDRVFVRHVDRLSPQNDEARKPLRRGERHSKRVFGVHPAV